MRMRDLRLLQIGKHFPPDTGGIETVMYGISNALQLEGIRADVLCFGITGRAYPPLDLGYEVVRASPTMQVGNKVVSIEFIRKLRALEHDYDAALLHLPNPVAALGVIAYWRKPLILLWHADVPQPYVRKLLAPLDRQ